MNNVIKVLEQMASDASLIHEENISALIKTSEINITQQQAIAAKNIDKLADTISDLPKIIAYSQVLPVENDEQDEDEENDDSQSTNKLLAFSF